MSASFFGEDHSFALGLRRGISAEYPSLERCQRTLPLDAEIVKNIVLAYLNERGYVDSFNKRVKR